MPLFEQSRASMDAAYATGMERIALELDGEAPAPPPAAATATVATAPAAADTGPGFWSRLGSGIAAVAGRTADLAETVASRIDVAPISAKRTNAAAQVAQPPSEPPWGLILGGIAAAVVLLATLARKG